MSLNTSLVVSEKLKGTRRSQFLLDSILAIAGSLVVTAIIYFGHLYPRIHNISIVYLLVILALASTRSSYAAILASVVATLAFDFFLVPPLYTFTMYDPAEWVALFIFLVDAILTGELASRLRKQTQQATRREHEARVLYDLVRETTREETLSGQLQVLVRFIQQVFSVWGVRECAILQPDERGKLQVRATTTPTQFSSDELAIAQWVMQHGQRVSLPDEPACSPSARVVRFVLKPFQAIAPTIRRLRWFLPLQVGQQTVAVLCLYIIEQSGGAQTNERLDEVFNQSNTQRRFFDTFLDQAAALIERARLRSENMRVELLQRTDALRAALLSSVSHDLRTPLAIIKASASSLLQEDVAWNEEERRGFAATIEREADRLNHLVGNLLDMSRIENGALKPEKEWYHFPSLLIDVLERLQPLLKKRDVRLHIPDDLPPIELDYLQIDQVLTNLIENATRYTPVTSPIEIDVQNTGEEIVVSVADRGPGIPEQDLQRIFDKFYRVLPARPSEDAKVAPGGTGLGLAVCKGLVEAHGGRIWATTREGGGMVFSFTLPIGHYEGEHE